MDEFEALLSKFEETTDEPSPKEKAPKPAILVVDDDESMRRGLTRMLSENFDVTAAENGKRAIEESERQQFYTWNSDIRIKRETVLPKKIPRARIRNFQLTAVLCIWRRPVPG